MKNDFELWPNIKKKQKSENLVNEIKIFRFLKKY